MHNGTSTNPSTTQYHWIKSCDQVKGISFSTTNNRIRVTFSGSFDIYKDGNIVVYAFRFC